MKRFSAVGTTLTILLFSATPDAPAHEGHGDPAFSDSILHYLVEPVHLGLLVVACLILIVFARLLRNKRKSRKKLQRVRSR